MWNADQLVLNGRFKILSPLGKGAFSEAYLAEQVGLSRKVVVKTLSAQLGHDLDGRFGAEVRSLAAVDHPSVVRVLDFGLGDGVVFVVTEHVEGTSLAKAIGTEPLLPDRALALFGQLAEGLAAIHARGLLHLGLSADTVFLAQTPLGERARMADFGVARLLDPATEGNRLTAVLAPVQHRVYQSPEQAMGGQTDARSDLFVLGILGYQMLSGRLPFSPPQTPADVPQAAPPLPLAEAAPHLKDHPRIVELVMRCLQKDPAARPQQALELAQRLTAVPEVGEPTILMEAYQGLPPALPLRPAAAPAAPAAVVPPALPAQASPAVPRPLLPSVEVPALTPAPVVAAAPAPVAPSAPPVLKRWGLIAVALAALVAVAATARWALRSPADDARAQIDAGKAIEALTALDAALAQKGAGASPELVAVKAIALHRLDRHKDELTVVREGLTPSQPAALDAQLLAGLSEDFGRREEPAVRELLHRLPKEHLAPALIALAKGAPSPAQWGAARYLDLEQQGQGVDLVAVYVEGLRSDACAVRRTAAKRLGQLGDWRAAEPLATLVNTPRSSTPEKACGQDEATEAITKLKPPAR